MKFKYNSVVYSSEGNKVGKLKELVVDPRSQKVTHLVVAKGILFTSDRVVPSHLVDNVDGERVVLSVTEDELKARAAREYVEEQYVKSPRKTEVAPSLSVAYWVRPPKTYTSQIAEPPPAPPGIAPLPSQSDDGPRVPLEDVVLEKGTEVWSEDDRHIGHLDECVTNDEEKITHLILQKGHMFTSPKMIPVDWVRDFRDNKIVLAVHADTVEQLPDADVE